MKTPPVIIKENLLRDLNDEINNSMNIKFKFPAIVIYTSKVSKGKGYVVRGRAIGFFVIIGKPYARDLGLLAHELSHVQEWWTKGGLIHNILYGAIRKYRLHSECRAYHKQFMAGETQTEMRKQDFVDRIWLFYNLKYTRKYIQETFYKYFKT